MIHKVKDWNAGKTLVQRTIRSEHLDSLEELVLNRILEQNAAVNDLDLDKIITIEVHVSVKLGVLAA